MREKDIFGALVFVLALVLGLALVFITGRALLALRYAGDGIGASSGGFGAALGGLFSIASVLVLLFSLLALFKLRRK
jgi:hypothetical protein